MEELRIGWKAPVLTLLALLALGLRLQHAPITYDRSRTNASLVYGLATLFGLAFGTWRVAREQQAPDFLASRSVSPGTVLAAKILASLVDVGVILMGLLALAYAVYPRRGVGPNPVATYATLAAAGGAVIGVCLTWTLKSRWISVTASMVLGIISTYFLAMDVGRSSWGLLDKLSPLNLAGLYVLFACVLYALTSLRGRPQ